MTNTRLHSLQTFCFAPAQQVCPQKNSLAACPSGRRAGWAVRLFDSLVLSEIPNAVFVLVCRLGQEADSGAVSEAEGDADGAGEAAAPAAIPKPKKPTRRERRAGRVLVGHDRRAHDRADRRL